MQTYAPWWIDLDENSAGPFLLLPCSWALPLLVGPHHADQLCLPAHVGKVHLGLLLTLPAPYETLIPKPLRPCFVRLAKPAAASAFFLPCCICTPYSRGAPAAPPHPTTFSAAHGSDQPCVLPPPQRSRVRLPVCRPPERRHQEPSSIAATPPGAACPGARTTLV